MKKIKSIGHLKTEQKKLDERRERLESAIAREWKTIKKNATPGNMAIGIFNHFANEKNEGKINGKAFLTESLIKFAGKKISKIFSER